MKSSSLQSSAFAEQRMWGKRLRTENSWQHKHFWWPVEQQGLLAIQRFRPWTLAVTNNGSRDGWKRDMMCSHQMVQKAAGERKGVEWRVCWCEIQCDNMAGTQGLADHEKLKKHHFLGKNTASRLSVPSQLVNLDCVDSKWYCSVLNMVAHRPMFQWQISRVRTGHVHKHRMYSF